MPAHACHPLQGHYSTVWRVLDAETGQHCAMKVGAAPCRRSTDRSDRAKIADRIRAASSTDSSWRGTQQLIRWTGRRWLAAWRGRGGTGK